MEIDCIEATNQRLERFLVITQIKKEITFEADFNDGAIKTLMIIMFFSRYIQLLAITLSYKNVKRKNKNCKAPNRTY